MAAGSPDPERHPAIREAAAILRRGGLVAFPTETVYGLGADAGSAAAVDEIFAVKGRPADNPVIVHVADLDAAARVGDLEDAAVARLLRRFWPGPLTVVVAAREPYRSAACRGLDTVAVRMPAHPVARALIRAAGRPIAAPSANLSGRPSPTRAAHVLEDLGGRIPLILDGGPCAVGIESTVLDLSGPRPAILRPGAVRAADVAAAGLAVAEAEDAGPARSPGTRYLHYRPRAPVVVAGADVPPAALRRLVRAVADRLGDGRRIGLVATRGELDADADLLAVDRSAPGSLARHLYDDLRSMDRRRADLVFVEGVDAAEPVMDRLRRAASCQVSGDEVEDPRLVGRILGVAARRDLV